MSTNRGRIDIRTLTPCQESPQIFDGTDEEDELFSIDVTVVNAKTAIQLCNTSCDRLDWCKQQAFETTGVVGGQWIDDSPMGIVVNERLEAA